jgi:hypothetical protein
MANPLSHLEDMAEQLVEGTFARMFRTRLQPIEVARRIARAMEDGQVINPQGRIVVPNVYQVYLSPDDFSALETYQDTLQTELARYVASLARSAGATMPGRPRVALHANAAISLRRVRVEARLHSARHGVITPGQTQAMPTLEKLSVEESPTYVLRDSYRRMPIDKAVITIGRGLNNDIILDDKHVSREHAQLRRHHRQYVLYDLDTTGGTKVNDRPVRDAPLEPGDVISFAGTKVRFELADNPQPTPEAPPTNETRPLPRPRRSDPA